MSSTHRNALELHELHARANAFHFLHGLKRVVERAYDALGRHLLYRGHLFTRYRLIAIAAQRSGCGQRVEVLVGAAGGDALVDPKSDLESSRTSSQPIAESQPWCDTVRDAIINLRSVLEMSTELPKAENYYVSSPYRDAFDIGYPQENLEGEMYKHRCKFCKKLTTEINGRLENHADDCAYRLQQMS